MSESVPPVIYQPAGGGSTAKGCGIGCLIALGSMAVIACVGIYVVWSVAGTMLETFTDETARPLPAIEMPQEERDALLARAQAFGNALETGVPAETLRLNSNEINVLLRALAPDALPLLENIHVSIEDTLLKADVSIPSVQFGIPGRYVNGTGVFEISLKNGAPAIYLQDFTVGSKAVPRQLLDAFRSENMAQGLSDDPVLRRYIEQLDAIEVTGGEIVLTPKTAASP